MATQKPYRPDRAEIVWIQHDPQVKREMKGRHPMMVLSPKAFVERTGLVIGLPLTCSGFNADHWFAVPVVGHGKEVGYILCHQSQSFDWQLRGGGKRPWGVAPKRILRQALDKLDVVWGVCEH